jgi:hypothetical protein
MNKNTKKKKKERKKAWRCHGILWDLERAGDCTPVDGMGLESGQRRMPFLF